MKKILWLIFLSFLIVTNVDAKVYYSDYSDFSQFQEEEVFPSDTVDVIKEEMYLWYKNVNKLGDYKLYNSVDSFSNDCYMTEFTDWFNQKIDNVGYNYEERNAYYYTMATGIRYIHLYNLQGSYGSFRIPELDIQYKNKSLKYTYTCNGCLEGFDDYIHNGIYEENKSYIANGGSLIIDLGKEYPLHLIDVIFYIFDLGNSDKTYTIGYSTDKENLLYYKQYVLKFSDEYWKNAVKRFHNSDEIDDSIWKYNETYVGLRNNDFVIAKESIKQYRYQEKWCRIYETFKEYSDYSKEPIEDYVYKVEDSLKSFYSYRTRDKIELEIKDIIEKNYDLNNFIISSSDKVIIKNNINWDKNGIYDISFQVNDLVVNEKVRLNIESNTIQELNELINNLKNEYENKIKELEEKLNNCKLDKDCLNKKINKLNNIITQYEKDIFDLNNQILNYQNEINNLNKLNSIYLNKIKKLEDDINNLNNSIGNIINSNKEQLYNYELKNEKLTNELNSYKKIKSDLQNSLNHKDNNNVLTSTIKIRFLDGICILILFLIILYIFYLIGRKSNKK